MDFSKIKNKFLICLCCVVLILPFYLITFTYATEGGDYNLITNNSLFLSQTGSLINSSDEVISYFLELEPGYTYTVSLSYTSYDDSNDIRTGFVNSISSGSQVYLFNWVSNPYTITINSDDYNYFYFGFQNRNTADSVDYEIIKTKNEGMISTVSNLVDNVGINSFWNIFDISIIYIVVVVLCAFGMYMFVTMIVHIYKGREGL